jgi:hypothetical protein
MHGSVPCPAFARLLDVSNPALDNSADARDVNLSLVWMIKHLAEIDAAANHGAMSRM